MSYAAAPSGGLDRDQQSVDRLYSQAKSLSEVWEILATRYPQTLALLSPHESPPIQLSFQELYQQMQQFAAGLQSLGVQPGDCLALFADNSPRWLIADQACMMAGAINTVRSSQADVQELLFIAQDSGASVLIAEDLATLQKLKSGLAGLSLRAIALLSDQPTDSEAAELSVPLFNFSQILSRGAAQTLIPVSHDPSNLATLMYTSGTTGKPKGVMVTHKGLLQQVNSLGAVIQPQAGDRAISILPTWHAYERVSEYFLFSLGCSQIYTNIRYLKQDLKQFQPKYMIGVPRLWESLYEGVQKQFREQPASRQRLVNFFFGVSKRYVLQRRIAQGLDLENYTPSTAQKILAQLQALLLKPLHSLGDKLVYQKVRAALGGQFKQIFSGGGSLATHLDLFYEIIGIELLVGYGLTETAVVLSGRRSWDNLRGSAGKPIPGTEIKIVDPETKTTLPLGQKGLVMAKGPQVMPGYFNNPEATAKVLDSEGWFDTGDFGWLTSGKDLILTGRLKDTIVLTNGENIEPQPIEDACLRSPYIDQIVLVGQDQRMLGALIVPNIEALEAWARTQNLDLLIPTAEAPAQGNASGQQVTLESKVIQDLFRQELTAQVKNRPGYRPDDRIGPFRFILEPFSVENGLMTQTLKIRRNVVMERYRDMINGMFD
jgi:long-chain acyl-CoA synthetase